LNVNRNIDKGRIAMTRQTISLMIAGSIASALAAASAPAGAAGETENCYGVALKGQNDCASASHSCAGQATISYDGQSWKGVPKGTCVSIKSPFGPGSLTPIKRPV
jgi:uncharacterized membrane protein